MKLNKTGKQIINIRDAIDSARHELFKSSACLPNLQGQFGDISSSIRSAEAAVKKVNEAIQVMKEIK